MSVPTKYAYPFSALYFGILLILPQSVFARDLPVVTTFEGLIDRFNGILNALVPFIVGLAVFVVMWGIFGYISHAEEEEKRTEAKQFITWGLIFILIMISVWGLVNILTNSFNLTKTAPSQHPNLPTIPQ